MWLWPETCQCLAAVPDKVGTQAWDQKAMGMIGIVQPIGDQWGQHSGVEIQECCKEADLYRSPP